MIIMENAQQTSSSDLNTKMLCDTYVQTGECGLMMYLKVGTTIVEITPTKESGVQTDELPQDMYNGFHKVMGINDSVDEYGCNQLMFAAYYKDCLPSVKRCLEMGANVNARDHYTYDALMLACQRGNSEIAKELIAAGANVKATVGDISNYYEIPDYADGYDFGYTALLLATLRGDVDSVDAVIAAGADVNHTSCYGVRPITIPTSPDCVYSLIRGGADVNYIDNVDRYISPMVAYDYTKVQIKNSLPLMHYLPLNHEGVVQSLIAAGSHMYPYAMPCNSQNLSRYTDSINDRSLQNMCRLQIRRSIFKRNGYQPSASVASIKQLAKQLCLSKIIENYLLYK